LIKIFAKNIIKIKTSLQEYMIIFDIHQLMHFVEIL